MKVRFRPRHPVRWMLLFAGLLVLFLTTCVPSKAVKQVKSPREGRAVHDRIAIVYSKHYVIGLAGFEKLHPFDTNKYTKIYLQLIADGLITPEDVFVPEPIAQDDLLRVHTPAYLARLQKPACLARYLEFAPAGAMPAKATDAAILSPFRHATGGTLLAARLALKYGIAVNLGGGYHHAEPDTGGGFCIYADMPVAIRVLQAEGLIKRVLVVDLDVHQGNGTAVALQNDDSVFTFDMHEEDIYPSPKERNDLDVPLPPGVDDAQYLAILKQYLPAAFERSRPELVIYQAGADVLAGDPLANLRLSVEGVVARDQMVLAEAVRRNVPIVMVLGGGYSVRTWYAQYRSIRALLEHFTAPPAVSQPK